MISRINLSHYKAFENLELELRPLTFFLGPNNSGKSSIISILRILAQTIESYDMNVPLLLNGSLGDFGTYKDIVYNNYRGRKLGVGIWIKPDDKTRLLSSEKEIFFQLYFKYRTGRREIILNNFGLSVNGELILKTEYSQDSERQLPEKIGKKAIPSSFKFSLSDAIRFQNFIPQRVVPFLLAKGTAKEIFDKDIEETARAISRAANEINREFRNIEYVGAMRVPPTRTFLYTGENRNRVGPNGQFAANILALDSAKGGKKSKQIIFNIRKWLKQAQMASDLKIESISDRHYEIKVQHPISKEFQNFADVGFGHSQVLPVLIAGYNLKQGGILLIEQPEIHLHPKAQSELGDYFLELYQNGIQSLVETHSEHMILRLQQHVIEGSINYKDIVFYYVHAKDGKKVVEELELDENGKFVKEWPEGFFPEKLNESKKIAQLRFAKSQKTKEQ